MQEPGLFGVGEQPCGDERRGDERRGRSRPRGPPAPPDPTLPKGLPRIPCAISRFSSPSEMPTGMLGLVGRVTVSPLAGM